MRISLEIQMNIVAVVGEGAHLKVLRHSAEQHSRCVSTMHNWWPLKFTLTTVIRQRRYVTLFDRRSTHHFIVALSCSLCIRYASRTSTSRCHEDNVIATGRCLSPTNTSALPAFFKLATLSCLVSFSPFFVSGILTNLSRLKSTKIAWISFSFYLNGLQERISWNNPLAKRSLS